MFMGQAREGGNGAAGVAQGVRCVVLHARPDARHPVPVPAELADSLERKGVRRVDVHSAFGALAEICAVDPRSGAREPAALLIVEPRLATPGDGLARLVASVAKFAAGVSVWRYERDAAPALRAIEPAAPRAATKPEVVVRKNAVGQARTPALRLAPESIHLPEAGPDADTLPAPSRTALLSDEELAMLLSDEPFPRPAKEREPR